MRSQFYALGAPGLSVLLAAACLSAPAAAETRLVRSGDNLQTALNAARPGDVLVLEAGAEFVGNFVLPAKSGDQPIVVRSTVSSQLPVEGVRIDPAHRPLLARLRSPNAIAVLRTAAGAHHWELRYLEIGPTQNGYGDIIQLGDGSSTQDTLAEVPQHFVLAHLYVHGDPAFGQKRGIALNAGDVTIRDSYISDCKAVGIDTQAIGGWNGPGPYLIENNYLEAAGENVMFGGSDPAIPNLVADGITFRRNYVTRPLAWRQPIIPAPGWAVATAETGGSLPAGVYAYRVVARRSVGQGTIGRSTASTEATAVVSQAGGAVRVQWEAVPGATEYRVYGRTSGAQDGYWKVTTTTFVDSGVASTSGAVPTSEGTVWSVKNLFELKNARNVVIEDNVFEHHWKESQPGYSIVFTPRNSNGACTWCVVENVRFEHNVVRRVAAGINLLGYDSASRPTQQTHDIIIRNNVFYEMAGYGGTGWFLLIGDEPRDVVVDHNTISQSGNAVMYAYGGSSSAPRPIRGFRFTNNAARHSSYGVNGDFFGYGNGVIGTYFPSGVVAGNYLAGGSSSRYPAGNRMTGTFDSEFVSVAQGDFRLVSNSQLRGTATDGGDIGADIGTLVTRVTNVETGLPTTQSLTAPANLRVVER